MPPVMLPLSLRLSSTIKLPHLDCEPGPIHTILHDGHNIYYSDEVNHSIVSLNTSGAVCWHRSKKGNAPGEFHYPKGIELGWINEKGARIQCVAVCDSWNRRIQFFDHAGGFIAIWDRAEDIIFSDPVDIRFIAASDDCESPNSYWLILDRGHHTLFGLDQSGNLIHRIGRCFPDNLESHWPTPGDSPNPQAPSTDCLSACLPYDPLFLPSRIFGNTHEALFVWEPKSRCLKQSVSGNLLPIWIDLPPGAEWVGVDASGLLCHDAAAGLLRSYDITAKSWLSLPIEGTPVQSGRTSNEVWTQNNSLIQHWICELDEEEKGGQDKSQPWMLCLLADEIKHIIQKEFSAADMDRLMAQ
jgi:hypothetical protein